MDAELEHEGNEVENISRTETPTVCPNDTEDPSITETEGVTAEVAPSDQERDAQPPEEPPLEEDNGDLLHGVSSSTTGEHGDVTAREVSEQPSPHEEATSPSPEVGGACGAGPADREHISHDADAQLHRELWEERGQALQRSSHLQALLTEYLRKQAEGDAPPAGGPQAEPLQEYEACVSILTELRRQLATESEAVPQQAELLGSQAQEQLAKVESEWQALMALKRDVAVTVLSRSLGKQSAQEKVASTLAAEQLWQDQLIKARTKHMVLRARIDRLEAELRDAGERDRDPLRIWFKQLQVERLKQKKHIEKQNEEMVKLQKKISGNLELLSNVKEKLCWSQTEVQAKREQLADVEAVVATKRDLLTRAKRARDGLQRDNQRLKEHRGLLGSKVLLQDFEHTVDAVDHLEEQLQNLQSRWAEIGVICGRSKKQLNEGLRPDTQPASDRPVQ